MTGQQPKPVPGQSGRAAWKAAVSAHNRALRNRRAKRPGPKVTGVRIPPAPPKDGADE